MLRLVEANICRDYYSDKVAISFSYSHLVDEKLCKADDIQIRVAYLTGWFYLVESLVSVYTTFYDHMTSEEEY